MKIMGTIRRFDDLGRIVIPKEIRRLVFGKADAIGEPMEIFFSYGFCRRANSIGFYNKIIKKKGIKQ